MNKPRILHIAQDEKFINAAHYLFEKAFPGDNRFIVIKPPADPPVKYVSDEIGVEYVVHSPATVPYLLDKSQEVEVIVFHGLDRMKGALFLRSSEKHKFVANIYGAEVYNTNILGDDYLGEKTRRLNQELQRKTAIEHLKELCRSVKYRDTRHLYDDVDMKEVLFQLKFCGFMSEFTHRSHIKRGVLNPQSRMVLFSYYPLDYVFKDHTIRAQGSNILLGNSASYTNNHLEAIDFLGSMNLNGQKVITPLSYGYEDYADEVQKYGRRKLGERFEPIKNFIPLNKYNQLMSSCQYVVMNHYRSQAMGNLIASLYMGAKVFVNQTDAYQYFKNIGCNIYLLDDLIDSGGTDHLYPLTQQEVNHNRKVLEKELSTNILIHKMREAFLDYFGLS